jgi:hypothetical protein
VKLKSAVELNGPNHPSSEFPFMSGTFHQPESSGFGVIGENLGSGAMQPLGAVVPAKVNNCKSNNVWWRFAA